MICLCPVRSSAGSAARGHRSFDQRTDKSLLHDVNEPMRRREAKLARRNCHGVGRADPGMFIMECGLRDGGARRDRTDDLKLAKLALSQLSYGPGQSDPPLVCERRSSARPKLVGLERVELSTSRLSSARSNQLSYRPETTYAPLCDPKERETKTAVSRQNGT
jgi:hypothetical protein